MPGLTPFLRRRRTARTAAAPRAAANDRLSDLDASWENPGNLDARIYVPAGTKGPMPLVVVLHGCTQNAALYDHGAGWSTLAERHGFALLFPEQKSANNPMLCFNWFSGSDTTRGKGEAASIAGMIEAMQRTHAIDPARIFVTGLSAGGAMASAMLATYPDVFAAGAILAGVAYGCAGSIGEAFDCMGGRGRRDATRLAGDVRRASRHKGPWPRVQVWQGSADRTVVPSNADAIVSQWTHLHGLAASPDRLDEVEGYPRRVWLDAAGEALVEHYSVTGMAHGVPIDRSGKDALGAEGAHMLDVGLSSTARIAAFFGIAPEAEERARPRAEAKRPAPRRPETRPEAPGPDVAGPQAVIERALKAAGLMR